MISRSVSELHFVTSREPLPSIEIQADSLGPELFRLSKIVSLTLSSFAKKNPASRATIYSYSAMSANFHTPSWSEFLFVAGDQKVLKALYSAFSSLPKVNVRHSDYIAPKDGTKHHHIEDGRYWKVEDAATWYSETSNEAEDDQVSLKPAVVASQESGGSNDLAGEFNEYSDLNSNKKDHAASEVGRVPKKSIRFRTAQADDTVTITRQRIEKLFDLPEGSVALCGPDGSALKGNAFIKTLRRRWEEG